MLYSIISLYYWWLWVLQVCAFKASLLSFQFQNNTLKCFTIFSERSVFLFEDIQIRRVWRSFAFGWSWLGCDKLLTWYSSWKVFVYIICWLDKTLSISFSQQRLVSISVELNKLCILPGIPPVVPFLVSHFRFDFVLHTCCSCFLSVHGEFFLFKIEQHGWNIWRKSND